MVKAVIAPRMDEVGDLNNEGEEEEASKTNTEHGSEDGSDDKEADAAVAVAVDNATKSAARGNGGSGGSRHAAQQHKCSVRGCKLGKNPTPMNICAANVLTDKKKCERTVHVPCFEHLVVKNSNGKIPPVSPEGDMAGKVFCTTGCYTNYTKAFAVGYYNWGNDGQNGALDCSEVLLVNRFLSDEEEFSKYRAPPNGQTKLDVCTRWANTINSCGVMKQRSGKDVQNKVTDIEAKMKLAQDFSESDTGQGLQDGSIAGSWEEAVKQRCKYWFLLQPVFCQRAGMKPMDTTEDMLKSSDDDESEFSFVNFEDNNGGGYTSSDDEDSSVVEVKEGRNPEEEEGEETTKKKTPKKKTTTKKTPKKTTKKTRKSGGSDTKQTPSQAQRNTDEKLGLLLSLKVADLQYKKRMRKKEEERSKRRRLEDYDLDDCDQWIEFAGRFEAIKATMGGCAVRTVQ